MNEAAVRLDAVNVVVAGNHSLTTSTCAMKSTWTLSHASIVALFLTLAFTAVSTSSLQMAMGLLHILKFYSEFAANFVLSVFNLIVL